VVNQIFIGMLLVGVTVVIQALFTVVGLRCLDWIETRKHRLSHRHAIFIIVFFVVLMFAGITVDICVWAAFYHLSEALPHLEEALYFSASTFTTLGYGDIIPSKSWRLIASFEAGTGLMIFGWATAFVMIAIQHFYVSHRSK
jgi:voltage-gated potassium channel Kch